MMDGFGEIHPGTVLAKGDGVTGYLVRHTIQAGCSGS
jgi:hypothetical protein